MIPGFKFYGITDRNLTGEKYFHHLEKAFQSGVGCIQIREKDLSPVELYQLCERIRSIAEPYDVKILINDRIDIALSLGLNGVHLTSNSLPADRARMILRKQALIGVSTHSESDVQSASGLGADFVVLGPVAPSPSKPAGHPILSLDEFHSICDHSPIPVYALGGMTLANVKKFIEAGAAGVAGISLLMQPEGLEQRLYDLKVILGSL
ncbi:thiamine phosphate synthase [bacterium]|nr:thiamine phosphate synthase [bacterium]